MKCKYLELSKNHGHPSAICRASGADLCPIAGNGVVKKITPDCWKLDYDRTCRDYWKIVENGKPQEEGKMKENRCADCGDLLTTEEEIRHGACNSCYAMAVCPEAIAAQEEEK